MKKHLESIIHTALSALDPALASTHVMLERPRDPDHGDWSSAIALGLAKSMRLAPRTLAEQIVAHIAPDPMITSVSIAGPGFINITLSPTYFCKQIDSLYHSPSLGVDATHPPYTVVVDYSSPNLAKEMHVGHLRSTIIGDALANILAFKGIHVIRQNHIGDWGTQFGMLLAHMHSLQKTKEPFALSDIEHFYMAAKKRFDADPLFAEEARAWVVRLQAHEPESLSLWQQFIHLSLAHCQAIYTRLGVQLSPEDVRAESAYNDALPLIVQLLQQKGLITDQDGTQCVFLDQFKGKDQAPLPIIVQKRDGGYLYTTSDLAALQYRQSALQADRILYVVDARQALHFQQIFALAKRAGLVAETMQLEHVEFGMILDKNGRPFKSRDGGVTKLSDLLDEAEYRADKLIAQKNPTMDPQERKTMATRIGMAAVKYADLSKNRIHDYVFDWDTMLSFEGNTAPYLLYANTRIHSLLHKAGTALSDLSAPCECTNAQDLILAKHLVQFPEVVDTVCAKALPHLLCTYLYELAGIFSTFYECCPILTAHTPAERQSRLKLAGLTSKILEKGLGLLGIAALTKM